MKATVLVFVLVAACGGSTKATKNPTTTTTATDCGEGSGSMGAPSTGGAGAGQVAPGGTSDATGSASSEPRPPDDPNGELGSQRLPMGPDLPPCHGKPASSAPSPVPPTAPPPAA